MHFLFWTKRSHPLPNNLYKSYAKCIQKLYKTLKLYLFCREMSYKLKLCMYKLYKIYTNVNRVIHAATDVCLNLYILYFSNFCINNDAIFCSILQLCKISGPIFSYSKIFTDEFILMIYLVLICFISTLIFLTFFYLNILKMCFF